MKLFIAPIVFLLSFSAWGDYEKCDGHKISTCTRDTSGDCKNYIETDKKVYDTNKKIEVWLYQNCKHVGDGCGTKPDIYCQ